MQTKLSTILKKASVQLKFILAYMQLKFIVLRPLILCFRAIHIENIFSLQFLTLTLGTQCIMKPSSISKRVDEGEVLPRVASSLT
jgi:hypothetical protein